MKELLDISAIAQIAILYFAIYAILRSAKGSRFGQALMGVGLLAILAAVFSFVFDFKVLGEILRILLIYLALSTVVIFQPEIRRILTAVGALSALERPRYDASGAVSSEEVVATLMALAEKKTGVLIAFERGITLRGYEETGVRLDAVFSRPLVQTIFTPPLPLHDGGMTMRNGRLSAAHCIFPVSKNPDLLSGGMRHRAAVGLSEETDALVVVVSEETGNVSIAHNGHLRRYTGAEREAALRRWVGTAMQRPDRGSEIVRRVFAFLKKHLPKGLRANVSKEAHA